MSRLDWDQIGEALAAYYGPIPTLEVPEDRFERLIEVALEQALESKTVRKALEALREAGLLTAEVLADADPVELADAWQPIGIRQPEKLAGPIRKLAKWVVDRYHADIHELSESSIPTSQLREELLAIRGIGPASADSILLSGLGRGSYPVDRASYRIMVRHGWLDQTADYDEARAVFESRPRASADELAGLSSWFTSLGRDFCKATNAKCEKCPLQAMLPEGGVIEPTD